jgi:hypothetical protein
MRPIRIALAFLFLSLGQPASAQNCFSDVSPASPFCENVEWLANRSITRGCSAPGQFCPNDAVTRLQMAAFMNRLAIALQPAVVRVEDSGGATDLSTQPVLCQTPDQLIADFPRTFVVWAVFTALGATNENLSIQVVRSTQGGAFVHMNQIATLFPLRNQVSNNTVLMSSPIDASAELVPGLTYRFGLRVARTTGVGNLLNFHCHLILEIRNRQGTSTPF